MSNFHLSNLSAVVLAGGFGTRVRKLLGSLPKPLAIVHNRPFIYWLISYLLKQQIHHIFYLTHYEAFKIENYVKEYEKFFKTSSCIVEDMPLGTGGGLIKIINEQTVKTDFILLINGDSLTPFDLTKTCELFDQGADAIIVAVKVKDTSRFGSIKKGVNDKLEEFNEKKEGEGLVNAGMYIFKSNLLKKYLHLKNTLSLELDLIPKLISDDIDIRVIESDEPFIDIGTENSLFSASFFIDNLIKNNSITEFDK